MSATYHMPRGTPKVKEIIIEEISFSRRHLGWFFWMFMAIIVLLIACSILLARDLALQASVPGVSPYSVISMSNGDIYFGELQWFPRPVLTSVWVLQRSVNDKNQTQLSVTPFTRAFWQPADLLYLNPRDIISWAPLQNGSQIVQAIENPSILNQQPGPAVSTSTSQNSGGGKSLSP